LSAVVGSGAAFAPAAADTLPACAEGSTGLVLAVAPAGHAARIERAGQSAPLADLTLLCPGDLIAIGAGETAQIEVQGDRGAGEPLEGPAEYRVPAAAGMLDNAAVAVANLLFPAASARTRTLVSRSDGSTMSARPENIGVRLPQELSYRAEPRALWFGWSGGVAPFHVSLEGSTGDVLAELDISASDAAVVRARYRDADGVVGDVPYDVTLPAVTLEPGSYRIRVSDAQSEPPEVAALMSDDDAGVLNLPILVRDDVEAIPSRAAAEDDAPTELVRIVEALCFSIHQPENRLFEAAQHVVDGRSGEAFVTPLALLGVDADQESLDALCR
jgi:hypothetical protein